MICAYAYARYSSDNQRAESIESQLAYIYDYADKNNIKIVRTYTDEATSGTHADTRNEFLRMLRDIEHRRDDISAVLIWDITRYARNSEEAISIENRLLAAGIELIATNQPLRTKKADGQIDLDALTFRRMQHVFAESGSFQNSKQTSAHMYSQSLRPGEGGHHPHLAGPAPYGYRIGQRKTYKDHRYLEINEDEAPAVRRMWQWADEGLGYRTIADRLNEMGFRSRRGSLISHTLVYEVLHHAVYSGTYVYGATRYNRITTRVKEANPNATIVDGGVPALIDKGLYDRVAQKLAMRKRAPKEKTNYTYILSGLLKCGECGGTMAGDSTSTKRTPTYRCAGKGCPLGHWRIGKKKIEKLVIDIVWDKFLRGVTPESIASQIEDMAADELTDLKKNIRNNENKIASEQRELNGLIDAMADPEMREIMKPRILQKRKELDELQLSQKSMLTELKTVERSIDISYIQDVLHKSLAAYSTWDEPTLKALAPVFISRVNVWKEKVEIQYTVAGGILVDTSRKTGFIWQSLGDSNPC